MERETKTIKTTLGHEVVLKTYLTGRETKAITDNDKFKDIDTQSTKNISVALALDFAIEVMKSVVVSIDGKVDDIVNTILDLPSSETNEIQQQSIEIYNLGFPRVK